MRNSLPLITIAMPLYNAEATVRSAILSIIQQTYRNWELIVLDDGSADESAAIVASINDPRIIFIKDNINRGISYRLNQALELAKGTLFARMDSDDISFPQRFEKQVEFMQSHSAIDLLATGVLFFENDGTIKGVLPVISEHNTLTRRPWNGFHMPHPTWLGRLNWFKKYYYRSSADKAEDQELLFRSYQSSQFACLPNVLLGYRQDSRSFKKMLVARKTFLKSFLRVVIEQHKFSMAFPLTASITLKIVADFLNIYCGAKTLRNRLDKASPDLTQQWLELWSKIHNG